MRWSPRPLLVLLLALAAMTAMTIMAPPAHAAVQDRYVGASSASICHDRPDLGYKFCAHVFSSVHQYSDSSGQYWPWGPFKTRFRVFFTEETLTQPVSVYRIGGTAHIDDRGLAYKPCYPVQICTYSLPWGTSSVSDSTNGADIIFNGASLITVNDSPETVMSFGDGVWFTFNDPVTMQVLHVMDNYGRDFKWCSQWFQQDPPAQFAQEDPGFCTPYLRN